MYPEEVTGGTSKTLVTIYRNIHYQNSSTHGTNSPCDIGLQSNTDITIKITKSEPFTLKN
jgi:hypothetical protein